MIFSFLHITPVVFSRARSSLGDELLPLQRTSRRTAPSRPAVVPSTMRNRNMYIFFDKFHPTQAVNTLIAFQTYNAATPGFTDLSQFSQITRVSPRVEKNVGEQQSRLRTHTVTEVEGSALVRLWVASYSSVTTSKRWCGFFKWADVEEEEAIVGRNESSPGVGTNFINSAKRAAVPELAPCIGSTLEALSPVVEVEVGLMEGPMSWVSTISEACASSTTCPGANGAFSLISAAWVSVIAAFAGSVVSPTLEPFSFATTAAAALTRSLAFL
ncbi:hypothetical protein Ahy_B06g080317 [Arachis hypogaea]|uniref:GDSL esterase/lipase n=1 Tax=Arachis hypogaea TaxID=3818 RepID=A0A444YHV0_ARAHY|nr:hypothetical protein Ahy_B06g080317 [Arachis hypogaea]